MVFLLLSLSKQIKIRLKISSSSERTISADFTILKIDWNLLTCYARKALWTLHKWIWQLKDHYWINLIWKSENVWLWNVKRINQNGSKISMHYYKDSARFCSIQKGMYRHWCEQYSLSKWNIIYPYRNKIEWDEKYIIISIKRKIIYLILFIIIT